MQIRHKNYCGYTEEFYCILSQCDLSLIEEQETSRYTNGLKYFIQECVAIQDVFSANEAHNKAIKIERLQSRALPFKGAAKRTSATQELSKVPHQASDLQPVRRLTPLQQTRRQQPPPLQRTKRIYMPSPGLASVTGVVNLDTGPMSVRRGGLSI